MNHHKKVVSVRRSTEQHFAAVRTPPPLEKNGVIFEGGSSSFVFLVWNPPKKGFLSINFVT